MQSSLRSEKVDLWMSFETGMWYLTRLLSNLLFLVVGWTPTTNNRSKIELQIKEMYLCPRKLVIGTTSREAIVANSWLENS
jgi:hypothetical protein